MKKRIVMFLAATMAAMCAAAPSLGGLPTQETVGDYTWTYQVNGGEAEIILGISPIPNGAVTIPSTLDGKPVTRIGIYEFHNYSDLTSVTIGNSVTSIGDCAFEGCSGLTSVTIPDSVTSVGDFAFEDCSGLTNVTIGNGVTNIGWTAFKGCSSLMSVMIPDSVTSIGPWAFEDCSGLTGVTIGNGVTSIGGNAFEGCIGLTSITIGHSVTNIESWAFYGCSSLMSVMFEGDAPSVSISTFSDVKSGCTAYVKRTASGFPAEGETWNGLVIAYQQDGGGTVTPDPVAPAPVVPDSVTLGYEVIEATDIIAPYEAPKAVALQGVVYDGGKVVGVVELKLGKVNDKKGTGKVSGSVTTLDGKKHTIKAFNLTEIDGTTPKTVSLEVKDFGTMSVTIGGTQFAGSMGKYHVQSANVGGNWSKGGTKVYVATSERLAGTLALPEGTIEELLPDGEPVIPKNGKWSFAKAASVKWAKPKQGAALPERYNAESGKGLLVDTSGDKTNLSAMKLTYTPKKGTFKGSFKVYALEGAGKATKLKKYTVKVSGVVVGGAGYGTATCKKPAVSWSVTVK